MKGNFRSEFTKYWVFIILCEFLSKALNNDFGEWGTSIPKLLWGIAINQATIGFFFFAYLKAHTNDSFLGLNINQLKIGFLIISPIAFALGALGISILKPSIPMITLNIPAAAIVTGLCVLICEYSTQNSPSRKYAC